MEEDEVSLSAATEPSVPPPSPLTGCYLLIVLSEPHTHNHKELILQRLLKGLVSWDRDEHQVDLEKELLQLTAAAPQGEDARYGERLIQFASENLVTEILIHPQMNTLMQCMRNLMSSFTRHRHIVHAGYAFAGNGSWIMQDGTFSVSDFTDAYMENEVQRVIRAYENSISIDIHCSTSGGGEWTALPNMTFTKHCKLRVNPTDVLDSGSQAIKDFIDYVEPFIVPASLEQLLVPSDVVGNIRFSRPTLYIFPGGQGDAALFGINGFNMLVDGGFSRKACWWDFARHLDRLDAVLLTRVNNCSVSGLAAVLARKAEQQLYPHIGHFFTNLEDRRGAVGCEKESEDGLQVSLVATGTGLMSDLKRLTLRPQHCYRSPQPINLYHKVGHGTLDMYVLNPSKDSKYVRDFLKRWHDGEQKLFASSSVQGQFTFPIPNMVSICALLVWRPANPDDCITRIMFPGSTPQHKIFEGLEKLRHLEFLQHPTCTGRQLATTTAVTTKSTKQTHLRTGKERTQILDTKEEKTETNLMKSKDQIDSKNIIDNKLINDIIGDDKKLESVLNEVISANVETKIEDKLSQYESAVIEGLPKKKEKKTVTDKRIKKPEKTEDNKTLTMTKSAETKKAEIEAKNKAETKRRNEARAKAEITSSIIRSKQTYSSQKINDKRSISSTMDRKSINDDKKSPPTTPKKTIDTKTLTNKESSMQSSIKDRIKSKPRKLSPGSTPAKSTKEANNRRVAESKYKQVSPKRDLPQKQTQEKKEVKKREPISRRTRPIMSPVKGLRALKSPIKSTKSMKIDPTLKGIQRVNYEDILKDAKKSDEETSKSLDDIKQQELDEKEEQEIVREIEAVFKRDSVVEERIEFVGRSDIEKITYIMDDSKNETAADSEFKEEYIIIEKEEIDQPLKDKYKNQENVVDVHDTDDKMNSLQHFDKRLVLDDKTKIKDDDQKELSDSVEEKQDNSSEKKTPDSKSGAKPKDTYDMHMVHDSHPDEKASTTGESGATTTAPTMPEDERITLDEIKENELLHEKHLKEDTKQSVPPKTLNTSKVIIEKPAKDMSKAAPIRDVVKTPDEVADLPLHEEVDYRETKEKKDTFEDDLFKRPPVVGFIHEIKVPKDLPLEEKSPGFLQHIQSDVVVKTMDKISHAELVTVTPGSAPESPMYPESSKNMSEKIGLEPVKEYNGEFYQEYTEQLRETHITTLDSPIKDGILDEITCMPEKIPSIPEDVEKEIEEARKLEEGKSFSPTRENLSPFSPEDIKKIVTDVAEVLKSDRSLDEIMAQKSPSDTTCLKVMDDKDKTKDDIYNLDEVDKGETINNIKNAITNKNILDRKLIDSAKTLERLEEKMESIKLKETISSQTKHSKIDYGAISTEITNVQGEHFVDKQNYSQDIQMQYSDSDHYTSLTVEADNVLKTINETNNMSSIDSGTKIMDTVKKKEAEKERLLIDHDNLSPTPTDKALDDNERKQSVASIQDDKPTLDSLDTESKHEKALRPEAVAEKESVSPTPSDKALNDHERKQSVASIKDGQPTLGTLDTEVKHEKALTPEPVAEKDSMSPTFTERALDDHERKQSVALIQENKPTLDSLDTESKPEKALTPKPVAEKDSVSPTPSDKALDDHERKQSVASIKDGQPTFSTLDTEVKHEKDLTTEPVAEKNSMSPTLTDRALDDHERKQSVASIQDTKPTLDSLDTESKHEKALTPEPVVEKDSVSPTPSDTALDDHERKQSVTSIKDGQPTFGTLDTEVKHEKALTPEPVTEKDRVSPTPSDKALDDHERKQSVASIQDTKPKLDSLDTESKHEKALTPEPVAEKDSKSPTPTDKALDDHERKQSVASILDTKPTLDFLHTESKHEKTLTPEPVAEKDGMSPTLADKALDDHERKQSVASIKDGHPSLGILDTEVKHGKALTPEPVAERDSVSPTPSDKALDDHHRKQSVASIQDTKPTLDSLDTESKHEKALTPEPVVEKDSVSPTPSDTALDDHERKQSVTSIKDGQPTFGTLDTEVKHEKALTPEPVTEKDRVSPTPSDKALDDHERKQSVASIQDTKPKLDSLDTESKHEKALTPEPVAEKDSKSPTPTDKALDDHERKQSVASILDTKPTLDSLDTESKHEKTLTPKPVAEKDSVSPTPSDKALDDHERKQSVASIKDGQPTLGTLDTEVKHEKALTPQPVAEKDRVSPMPSDQALDDHEGKQSVASIKDGQPTFGTLDTEVKHEKDLTPEPVAEKDSMSPTLTDRALDDYERKQSVSSIQDNKPTLDSLDTESKPEKTLTPEPVAEKDSVSLTPSDKALDDHERKQSVASIKDGQPTFGTLDTEVKHEKALTPEPVAEKDSMSLTPSDKALDDHKRIQSVASIQDTKPTLDSLDTESKHEKALTPELVAEKDSVSPTPTDKNLDDNERKQSVASIQDTKPTLDSLDTESKHEKALTPEPVAEKDSVSLTPSDKALDDHERKQSVASIKDGQPTLGTIDTEVKHEKALTPEPVAEKDSVSSTPSDKALDDHEHKQSVASIKDGQPTLGTLETEVIHEKALTPEPVAEKDSVSPTPSDKALDDHERKQSVASIEDGQATLGTLDTEIKHEKALTPEPVAEKDSVSPTPSDQALDDHERKQSVASIRDGQPSLGTLDTESKHEKALTPEPVSEKDGMSPTLAGKALDDHERKQSVAPIQDTKPTLDSLDTESKHEKALTPEPVAGKDSVSPTHSDKALDDHERKQSVASIKDGQPTLGTLDTEVIHEKALTPEPVAEKDSVSPTPSDKALDDHERKQSVASIKDGQATLDTLDTEVKHEKALTSEPVAEKDSVSPTPSDKALDDHERKQSVASIQDTKPTLDSLDTESKHEKALTPEPVAEKDSVSPTPSDKALDDHERKQSVASIKDGQRTLGTLDTEVKHEKALTPKPVAGKDSVSPTPSDKALDDHERKQSVASIRDGQPTLGTLDTEVKHEKALTPEPVAEKDSVSPTPSDKALDDHERKQSVASIRDGQPTLGTLDTEVKHEKALTPEPVAEKDNVSPTPSDKALDDHERKQSVASIQDTKPTLDSLDTESKHEKALTPEPVAEKDSVSPTPSDKALDDHERKQSVASIKDGQPTLGTLDTEVKHEKALTPEPVAEKDSVSPTPSDKALDDHERKQSVASIKDGQPTLGTLDTEVKHEKALTPEPVAEKDSMSPTPSDKALDDHERKQSVASIRDGQPTLGTLDTEVKHEKALSPEPVAEKDNVSPTPSDKALDDHKRIQSVASIQDTKPTLDSLDTESKHEKALTPEPVAEKDSVFRTLTDKDLDDHERKQSVASIQDTKPTLDSLDTESKHEKALTPEPVAEKDSVSPTPSDKALDDHERKQSVASIQDTKPTLESLDTESKYEKALSPEPVAEKDSVSPMPSDKTLDDHERKQSVASIQDTKPTLDSLDTESKHEKALTPELVAEKDSVSPTPTDKNLDDNERKQSVASIQDTKPTLDSLDTESKHEKALTPEPVSEKDGMSPTLAGKALDDHERKQSVALIEDGQPTLGTLDTEVIHEKALRPEPVAGKDSVSPTPSDKALDDHERKQSVASIKDGQPTLGTLDSEVIHEKALTPEHVAEKDSVSPTPSDKALDDHERKQSVASIKDGQAALGTLDTEIKHEKALTPEPVAEKDSVSPTPSDQALDDHERKQSVASIRDGQPSLGTLDTESKQEKALTPEPVSEKDGMSPTLAGKALDDHERKQSVASIQDTKPTLDSLDTELKHEKALTPEPVAGKDSVSPTPSDKALDDHERKQSVASIKDGQPTLGTLDTEVIHEKALRPEPVAGKDSVSPTPSDKALDDHERKQSVALIKDGQPTLGTLDTEVIHKKAPTSEPVAGKDSVSPTPADKALDDHERKQSVASIQDTKPTLDSLDTESKHEKAQTPEPVAEKDSVFPTPSDKALDDHERKQSVALIIGGQPTFGTVDTEVKHEKALTPEPVAEKDSVSPTPSDKALDDHERKQSVASIKDGQPAFGSLNTEVKHEKALTPEPVAEKDRVSPTPSDKALDGHERKQSVASIQDTKPTLDSLDTESKHEKALTPEPVVEKDRVSPTPSDKALDDHKRKQSVASIKDDQPALGSLDTEVKHEKVLTPEPVVEKESVSPTPSDKALDDHERKQSVASIQDTKLTLDSLDTESKHEKALRPEPVAEKDSVSPTPSYKALDDHERKQSVASIKDSQPTLGSLDTEVKHEKALTPEAVAEKDSVSPTPSDKALDDHERKQSVASIKDDQPALGSLDTEVKHEKVLTPEPVVEKESVSPTPSDKALDDHERKQSVASIQDTKLTLDSLDTESKHEKALTPEPVAEKDSVSPTPSDKALDDHERKQSVASIKDSQPTLGSLDTEVKHVKALTPEPVVEKDSMSLTPSDKALDDHERKQSVASIQDTKLTLDSLDTESKHEKALTPKPVAEKDSVSSTPSDKALDDHEHKQSVASIIDGQSTFGTLDTEVKHEKALTPESKAEKDSVFPTPFGNALDDHERKQSVASIKDSQPTLGTLDTESKHEKALTPEPVAKKDSVSPTPSSKALDDHELKQSVDLFQDTKPTLDSLDTESKHEKALTPEHVAEKDSVSPTLSDKALDNHEYKQSVASIQDTKLTLDSLDTESKHEKALTPEPVAEKESVSPTPSDKELFDHERKQSVASIKDDQPSLGTLDTEVKHEKALTPEPVAKKDSVSPTPSDKALDDHERKQSVASIQDTKPTFDTLDTKSKHEKALTPEPVAKKDSVSPLPSDKTLDDHERKQSVASIKDGQSSSGTLDTEVKHEKALTPERVAEKDSVSPTPPDKALDDHERKQSVASIKDGQPTFGSLDTEVKHEKALTPEPVAKKDSVSPTPSDKALDDHERKQSVASIQDTKPTLDSLDTASKHEKALTPEPVAEKDSVSPTPSDKALDDHERKQSVALIQDTKPTLDSLDTETKHEKDLTLEPVAEKESVSPTRSDKALDDHERKQSVVSIKDGQLTLGTLDTEVKHEKILTPEPVAQKDSMSPTSSGNALDDHERKQSVASIQDTKPTLDSLDTESKYEKALTPEPVAEKDSVSSTPSDKALDDHERKQSVASIQDTKPTLDSLDTESKHEKALTHEPVAEKDSVSPTPSDKALDDHERKQSVASIKDGQPTLGTLDTEVKHEKALTPEPEAEKDSVSPTLSDRALDDHERKQSVASIQDTKPTLDFLDTESKHEKALTPEPVAEKDSVSPTPSDKALDDHERKQSVASIKDGQPTLGTLDTEVKHEKALTSEPVAEKDSVSPTSSDKALDDYDRKQSVASIQDTKLTLDSLDTESKHEKALTPEPVAEKDSVSPTPSDKALDDHERKQSVASIKDGQPTLGTLDTEVKHENALTPEPEAEKDSVSPTPSDKALDDHDRKQSVASIQDTKLTLDSLDTESKHEKALSPEPVAEKDSVSPTPTDKTLDDHERKQSVASIQDTKLTLDSLDTESKHEKALRPEAVAEKDSVSPTLSDNALDDHERKQSVASIKDGQSTFSTIDTEAKHEKALTPEPVAEKDSVSPTLSDKVLDDYERKQSVGSINDGKPTLDNLDTLDNETKHVKAMIPKSVAEKDNIMSPTLLNEILEDHKREQLASSIQDSKPFLDIETMHEKTTKPDTISEKGSVSPTPLEKTFDDNELQQSVFSIKDGKPTLDTEAGHKKTTTPKPVVEKVSLSATHSDKMLDDQDSQPTPDTEALQKTALSSEFKNVTFTSSMSENMILSDQGLHVSSLVEKFAFDGSSEDISKDMSLEEKYSFESTEKESRNLMNSNLETILSHDESRQSIELMSSVVKLEELHETISETNNQKTTYYEEVESNKKEDVQPSETSDSGVHSFAINSGNYQLDTDDFSSLQTLNESFIRIKDTLNESLPKDDVQQGIKTGEFEYQTESVKYDRSSTPPTVPVSPLPKTQSSFADIKISDGVSSEVLYDKSEGSEETISKIVHVGDDIVTQKISTSTEKVPKQVNIDFVSEDNDITRLMHTMGKIKTETDTVTKVIKEGQNVVTQTITTITTREIISREDGTPQNIKTTIETTTLSKNPDGTTTSSTETQTLLSECSSSLKSSSEMDLSISDSVIANSQSYQKQKYLSESENIHSETKYVEVIDDDDNLENTTIDTNVSKHVIRENNEDIIETITTSTKKELLKREGKDIKRTVIETVTMKERPDGTKVVQKSVDVKTEEDEENNHEMLLQDLDIIEEPEEMLSTTTEESKEYQSINTIINDKYSDGSVVSKASELVSLAEDFDKTNIEHQISKVVLVPLRPCQDTLQEETEESESCKTEEIRENNSTIKRKIVTRVLKTNYCDIHGNPIKRKTVTTITTTDLYPDGTSSTNVETNTSIDNISNNSDQHQKLSISNVSLTDDASKTEEKLHTKLPNGTASLFLNNDNSTSILDLDPASPSFEEYSPKGEPDVQISSQVEQLNENGVKITRKTTVTTTKQTFDSNLSHIHKVKTSILTVTEDEYPDGSVITKKSERVSTADIYVDSDEDTDHSSDDEVLDTSEESEIEEQSIMKDNMLIKRKINTKTKRATLKSNDINIKRVRTTVKTTTTDEYPDGSVETNKNVKIAISESQHSSDSQLRLALKCLDPTGVIKKSTDKQCNVLVLNGKNIDQTITTYVQEEEMKSASTGEIAVKVVTETVTENKSEDGSVETSTDVQIGLKYLPPGTKLGDVVPETVDIQDKQTLPQEAITEGQPQIEVDDQETVPKPKQLKSPIGDTTTSTETFTKIINEDDADITQTITGLAMNEASIVNSKIIVDLVPVNSSSESYPPKGEPDVQITTHVEQLNENGDEITRKTTVTTTKETFDDNLSHFHKVKTSVLTVTEDEYPDGSVITNRSEKVSTADIYFDSDEDTDQSSDDEVLDTSEESEIEEQSIMKDNMLIKRKINTKTKRATLKSNDINIKRVRTTVKTTTTDEYPDGSVETNQNVKIAISESQHSSDSQLRLALNCLDSTGVIKKSTDKQCNVLVLNGKNIDQTITTYVTEEEMKSASTGEMAVKVVTETVTENKSEDGSVETSTDIQIGLKYLPPGTKLGDVVPETVDIQDKQTLPQETIAKGQPQIEVDDQETVPKPKQLKSPIGDTTTSTETFTKIINEGGADITQTITVITTKEVISPEKIKVTVETTTVSRSSDGVTKTSKSTKTTISEFTEEFEEIVDTGDNETSSHQHSSRLVDTHSLSATSDEAEYRGIASPPSDISSRGSKAAQVWGVEASSDEEAPGSPSSTKSQLAHSPRSNLSFELEGTRTAHPDLTEISFHADAMSTSIYGELPEVDPHGPTLMDTKISKLTTEKSLTKMTEDFLSNEKEIIKANVYSSEFLKEADKNFEKAIEEHKRVSGDEVISNITAKYELESQSHASSSEQSSSKEGIILKQISSDSKTSTELTSISSSSKQKSESKTTHSSETSSVTKTTDPIEDWGKPLGLPSPVMPTAPGTPKKQVGSKPKTSAKESRRVTESPSKKPTPAPVYVDLTYVPHHGNSYYSAVEFFKRVRARYYVFSGTEPSKEIYNALLDAKKTWEDKDREVTIVPTYDTDVLGYWVTENEEQLEQLHIDLSPSAARCTINLQDHETSCAAYRLEF